LFFIIWNLEYVPWLPVEFRVSPFFMSVWQEEMGFCAPCTPMLFDLSVCLSSNWDTQHIANRRHNPSDFDRRNSPAAQSHNSEA
jgi:hypothetical protein